MCYITGNNHYMTLHANSYSVQAYTTMNADWIETILLMFSTLGGWSSEGVIAELKLEACRYGILFRNLMRRSLDCLVAH